MSEQTDSTSTDTETEGGLYELVVLLATMIVVPAGGLGGPILLFFPAYVHLSSMMGDTVTLVDYAEAFAYSLTGLASMYLAIRLCAEADRVGGVGDSEMNDAIEQGEAHTFKHIVGEFFSKQSMKAAFANGVAYYHPKKDWEPGKGYDDD